MTVSETSEAEVSSSRLSRPSLYAEVEGARPRMTARSAMSSRYEKVWLVGGLQGRLCRADIQQNIISIYLPDRGALNTSATRQRKAITGIMAHDLYVGF